MAGVIDTSEFRKGLKIEVDGEPFEIVEFQHVKPGKGSAFVRTTIRSLLSGRVLQPTFKSGDKVGKPDIEELEMQYLYKQGDDFYFMDTANYEQIHISSEALGDSVNYLKGEMTIQVEFYGSEPVGIELPQTVDLKVTDTAPGIKGATASNQIKPATLETGVVVNVPPFINNGDLVRVNTETGEYLSRA